MSDYDIFWDGTTDGPNRGLLCCACEQIREPERWLAALPFEADKPRELTSLMRHTIDLLAEFGPWTARELAEHEHIAVTTASGRLSDIAERDPRVQWTCSAHRQKFATRHYYVSNGQREAA